MPIFSKDNAGTKPLPLASHSSFNSSHEKQALLQPGGPCSGILEGENEGCSGPGSVASGMCSMLADGSSHGPGSSSHGAGSCHGGSLHGEATVTAHVDHLGSSPLAHGSALVGGSGVQGGKEGVGSPRPLRESSSRLAEAVVADAVDGAERKSRGPPQVGSPVGKCPFASLMRQ